jgi:ATPase subunit of ABC transporter with duplicated ATPase domains
MAFIQFKNTGLIFPHKICFQNFTAEIQAGQHIALMGRNGSGKSSLLKILAGLLPPSEGEVRMSDKVQMAYVPQIIDAFETCSGGERFNKSLTAALATQPNLLLLDEPTNHLDLRNRKSLLRLLTHYPGTLLIASHDPALLRLCTDFWHLEQEQIHIIHGSYDQYLLERAHHRQSIETKLEMLKKQKKVLHDNLMQEQARAKTSRTQGEKHIEQRKWPTVVSGAKARRAQETSGAKQKVLSHQKEKLLAELSGLSLPEIIIPTFSLSPGNINKGVLVSITQGNIGYSDPLLKNIFLSVSGETRLAIKGDNGSGKSTLVKAFLNDPSITKTGEFILPKAEQIAYLDQHYQNLDPSKTVLEIIQDKVDWPHNQIRQHLNTFLFRKNEEVNAQVETLSGGEKARLSLAQIAARIPKLLILDEVTNNVDHETRQHLIDVLQHYPGALIVISHDEGFLEAIDITDVYCL